MTPDPITPSPFRYPAADRQPDAGTPNAARIAWVLVIALIGAILLLNQLGNKPEPAKPGPTETPRVVEIAPPDAGDQFALISKLLYKFLRAAGAPSPQAVSFSLNDLSKTAKRPVDQYRLAVIESEWSGPDEALKRLSAIEKPDEAGLEEDIRTLSSILNDRRENITDTQMEAFKAHHGWFARLALSRGLVDTDPGRAPLLAGGGKLLALLVVGGGVFGLLALGGLVSLTIAGARIFTKGFPTTLKPPARGGSVYLETVACFAAAFLAFKTLAPLALLAFLSPDQANTAMLLMQWLMIPTAMWALFRGVSFRSLREQLGWTTGKGVIREIGAGLFAYLASFPLLMGALGVTLGIIKLKAYFAQARGDDYKPPQNHIMDLLIGGGAWQLVLLYVLATVWAPIVEEAIFRGAFYRHLRARFSLVVAAAISALFFAVMHANDFLMLLPVLTLGFMFALMREWRTSLIASMTAHFLNNAMVLGLLIALLSILGDP